MTFFHSRLLEVGNVMKDQSERTSRRGKGLNMLQYGAFKVSCLMLMWMRFVCGSATEARAAAVLGGTPLQESPVKAVDVELEGTEKEEDATFRNFFPVKGRQKWMRRAFPPVTEMLFFNVSAIGDDEEITLARLHLLRKRLTKTHQGYGEKHLPSPYRVVLYQVQPDHRLRNHEDAGTTKLAALPVSHLSKGGWQALDVTAVVREVLINAQGPVELLLGVYFQAPKRSEKPHSPLVPLKHFLRSPWHSAPEHPYRASSRLVVFSEKDPYFEDLEENETPPTRYSIPALPDSPGEHSFKERHLKHKIFKGKTGGEDADEAAEFQIATNLIEEIRPAKTKTFTKGVKEKNLLKHYDKTENEVLKSDVKGPGGKRKKDEVRRSKADELALRERTKLKSLPFLHTNEVEEIRQTSRRLTRSSEPQGAVGTTQGDAQEQKRKQKLIKGGKMKKISLKR